MSATGIWHYGIREHRIAEVYPQLPVYHDGKPTGEWGEGFCLLGWRDVRQIIRDIRPIIHDIRWERRA